MDVDDIVYLSLLIFSIAFGYWYRQIEDKVKRKNVGTLAGLLIISIVSGVHIIHPIITTLFNGLILLYINRRKCHIVSFIFTFAYLAFFRTTLYFGIPYPPAHTNLVQMILTLKLAGLGFELNATQKGTDDVLNRLKLTDIFHYAFNYVGVLTGPYYKYKTFVDSFELPFAQKADWKQATIDKIKFVPLFAVLFLIASHFWPNSYPTTDEFYNERSWLYRYWYIWPMFFIFRMRIYIGLVLSECVCTMSGLGAYPTFTEPKSGEGPSKDLDKMLELSGDELERIKYDFETIHNISPYGADFCTTYRQGMKHWNMCVQYWLAVNVYKRFPAKKYRTFATVLTSAFWHGVYSGYYVCIGTVPLVLLLEDVYVKLLLKNDDVKGIWKTASEWLIWFSKMHFFSYQAVAFLLLDIHYIVIYYNSVYHIGLILGIILYLIGNRLLKEKRRKDRKNAEKH